MRAGAGLLALVLLLAGPALAGAPETSSRPLPRPGAALPAEATPPEAPSATADARAAAAAAAKAEAEANAVATSEPVFRSVRPKPRSGAVAPVRPDESAARRARDAAVVATSAPVFRSPRPRARPSGTARSPASAAAIAAARPPAEVRAAPPPGNVPSGVRGRICGDNAIRGVVMPRIAGNPHPQCGVANPVRVSEVAGIRLSQAAIMDCDTARALKTWVERGAVPALQRTGGGLVQLRVAAHYSCRTRNNQRGARVSEHGRGKAIDISGFTLRNGETITVLKGWRDRATSRALVSMHRAACGPFGTVLGPNADRFHQDHFHFDTARHRSGPYCR